MPTGKRAKRGSELYHAIMVRLSADQLDQLDFLCARWGRARGTLARQLITDGLSELLNAASPLRVDWQTFHDGRRPRNTTAADKYPTAKQARIALPPDADGGTDHPSEPPDAPQVVTVLPSLLARPGSVN